MQNIFYYIFYIFYKLSKRNNSVFPSNFVALVCILVLEIWLIIGILNEFYFFSNIRLVPYNIKSISSMIMLVSLIGINVYVYEYKNKWRNIIAYIDENKSKTKVFLAWFLVVLIIINYWVISIYLLKVKSLAV